MVGMDFAAGEKSVWVVEGRKYKASFLLEGAEGERLLVSEVSFFWSFPFYSCSCCLFLRRGNCDADAGDFRRSYRGSSTRIMIS